MSKQPTLLILLRTHERIRGQYHAGITQALPEVTVRVAPNVDAAEPFLGDADIMLTHGPHLDGRSREVFAKAGKLKWVQGIGTGTDNIHDCPTLRPDAIVTNIHGVHGAPMSEAAIMLMLALSRNFTRSLANKAARKWENWPSRLLTGKTVGILGMGSIANSMGPRFKALGMTVVGITSGVREVAGFDQVHDKARLVEVVAGLDYLVVLTPYSPATHHIIDARVLAAMKPDSYLINLARGGICDEAALIETLRARRIAGAALDVFAQEPLQPDNPLWDLDNVLITCHQAATHDDSARTNLPTIIANIRCFLAGDIAGMRNRVARTFP